MKRFICALAVLISPYTVHASEKSGAEGYLCVPDYISGFKVSGEGRWLPVNFNVNDTRHHLRNRDGAWYWTEFGEEPHPSIDKCTSFNDLGFLECKDREDEVLFNKQSLRYQSVRAYGYVVSDASIDRKHPTTPFYEIGRCSPI